jgi:tRNA A-37 threonylcarbamoyl transferase component Bud32
LCVIGLIARIGFLHEEMSLVHGGSTTLNVSLTTDEYPKIADFGSGRLADQVLTRTKAPSRGRFSNAVPFGAPRKQ